MPSKLSWFLGISLILASVALVLLMLRGPRAGSHGRTAAEEAQFQVEVARETAKIIDEMQRKQNQEMEEYRREAREKYQKTFSDPGLPKGLNE
jgi:hypothetical protein